MNKNIIAIIIVVIIGLGGYFLLRSPQQSTPPSSDIALQLPSQEASQTSPTSTTQAPVIQETPPVNQSIVTYNESGFSPSVLRVRVGTIVVFKNEESDPIWVASNPHPIHTDYSEFDARRGYTKGESYSFTFTTLGTWKYHDHLNSSEGGTIVVEN